MALSHRLFRKVAQYLPSASKGKGKARSHSDSLVSIFLPWMHSIISITVLFLTYRSYNLYFLQKVGNGAWAPAWPVPRTWLVLSMAAIPTWATLMLVVLMGMKMGVKYGGQVWRMRERSWRDGGGGRGMLGLDRLGRNGNEVGYEYEVLSDVEPDSPVINSSGQQPRLRRSSSSSTSSSPRHSPTRSQRSSKASRSRGSSDINLERLGLGWIRWRLWTALYVFLAVIGCYLAETYEQKADNKFKREIQEAVNSPRKEGYAGGEKVFIAAMFYNNERVVPYWIEEITKVIQYLGPENVFISIVESNSNDATPSLLRAFSEQLSFPFSSTPPSHSPRSVSRLFSRSPFASSRSSNQASPFAAPVPHRILTSDTSVSRPSSMDTALPRIEFLSAVRNRVMEPLIEQAEDGVMYERVIFSNDVFVTAESVVELLKTRDGGYDMACGMDLAYWGLHDAWVTRDRLGRLVSSLWPYLLEDDGMASITSDQPAPVFTCWNGIVSFRSEPFLPPHLRPSNSVLSKTPVPETRREGRVPSSHPWYGRVVGGGSKKEGKGVVGGEGQEAVSPREMPQLRFRASGRKECFGSESFNLPYDMRRVFDLQEIYMNPRVITSYEWSYFVWWKYITRHWLVKWWIENVENGDGMHRAKMVVGDPAKVWTWDGGECQPAWGWD